MNLSLLTALALAAGSPLPSATSSVELRMTNCGIEDEPKALREIITRNARFDVIDRYGEPLQVVRHEAWRRRSSCVDGSEGKVEFAVTRHPRDGGAASTPLRFSAEGEHPQVLDQLDWPLLRVTRTGCCAMQDGHIFLDPGTGKEVGRSTLDPLPLQVINDVSDSAGESRQATLQRYVFVLDAISGGFTTPESKDRQALAEITWSGPDRAAQRWVLTQPRPTSDDEQGDWVLVAMRWAGALGDDGKTLWVKGDVPTPAQVGGLTLELDLQCQCAAPPRTLRLTLDKDTLSDHRLAAQKLTLSPR